MCTNEDLRICCARRSNQPVIQTEEFFQRVNRRQAGRPRQRLRYKALAECAYSLITNGNALDRGALRCRSSSIFSFLNFALGFAAQAVFVEFVAQGADADAELARGVGAVAAAFVERDEDVPLLQFAE